jgi:predicted dehydrogenase
MKVLTIGTGIGQRVVAPIYRRLGLEVDVVSPRDSDAVRSAFARDVDLVSIHSPPALHMQHVMMALQKGCAVLCDKPFGRDAAEARAMRDRAQDVGALNFLNFEFRRQPSRAQLKRMLQDGVIGPLKHISWTFIGSGLRHQTHRWLFDSAQAGGWIGAYGSHAIDTVRWLFDDEVKDCGGMSRIETPSRVDRQGVEQAATAEDAFTAWFVMARGGVRQFRHGLFIAREPAP